MQVFDNIFHWIFHWCLLDSMDTADLSDSVSPSSPLPNAGGDTEAGLDLFRLGMSLQTLILQMFMDNCHRNLNFKLVPVVFMRGPSAEEATLV